jgi:hypothetical protein
MDARYVRVPARASVMEVVAEVIKGAKRRIQDRVKSLK